MGLADQFLTRVAADPAEGFVDRGDHAASIGDPHDRMLVEGRLIGEQLGLDALQITDGPCHPARLLFPGAIEIDFLHRPDILLSGS